MMAAAAASRAATAVTLGLMAASTAATGDDSTLLIDTPSSLSSSLPSSMNRHHQNHHDILIRFQNRTLLYRQHGNDVDDDDDISRGNTTSFTMMNKNALLLDHVSQVTGWKTRFLEIAPSKTSDLQQQQELLFVRVRVISGIRGGKGGFGALLKSQSRQAGAKSTTNFGACRDLQGRRLRHVNDQMALAHWQEWRQKINSGEAKQVDMVQATHLQTTSGVPGWHLQLPAWSDVSKKERRKWQMQFRHWKRQEEAKEESKRREREIRESRIQHYVDEANHAVASAQSNLQSALQEGLQQQQQSKRQKQENEPPLALLALSGDVEIVESTTTNNNRTGRGGGSRGTWQIQSQSNFCTIGIVLQMPTTQQQQQHPSEDENRYTSKNHTSFKNDDDNVDVEFPLHKDMILYYEVRLVTGGLAQIGWAVAPTSATSTAEASSRAGVASSLTTTTGCFSPDSSTGDGVGDDAYSYAYDGSRGICLHQSISKPFGGNTSWQKEDIVGCMYNISTGEISYFINGAPLGVAYIVSTAAADGPAPVILFPAASCNPGEVIELRLYSDDMQHIPEADDRSIPEQATLTMIGNVMATQDISFGLLLEMNDCDDDEEEDGDEEHADSKDKSTSNTGDDKGGGTGADDAAKGEGGKNSPLEEGEKKPAAADTVVVVEPIDLETFASALELESLGMNRLKGALMAMGVKCGGTLTERANRLFSLKGIAPEDYPKKLLAKRSG